MHNIYNKIFELIYERYQAWKIIFVAVFKSPFFLCRNVDFIQLLYTYELFFKSIFKKNFNLSKKQRRALLRAVMSRKLVNKHRTSLVKVRLFFFNKLLLIKNNFIIIYYLNSTKKYLFRFFAPLFFINFNFKFQLKNILNIFKKTFGEGFFYIRGLFIIFFIDACLTDDEPLWEPIEWSLFQTWLFFIFMFAWIAENLITSRYGSYTGRDKRVWLAWYKTFWLIELMYIISYGAASMFVIVPFYYELTYSLSFIYSWWDWYNKIFFFKFISLYSVVLLMAYFLQLNLKWMNWKKVFFLACVINFFIAYLLYTHFIMLFFAYFTDPLWYQKTRFIDYIQLSHEPLKWGWGPAKRDHFTYHKVSTVFWFKNDGPFAGAFLMFHLFMFLCIFFLYIYWLVLLRRVYTTKEATYTLTTYCVSALKQFFLFFLLLFLLVFISFIVCYWRFPVEFIWISNSHSWFIHFFVVFSDYFSFIWSIISGGNV